MQDKLRVLTIADRLIPSSIIGIIRPLLALQKLGEIEFRLAYTRFYKEKDIQKSDVIVLCRSMRPEDLRIIYLAKKYQKKLIYDIDDNFFELSTSTPLGRYHRYPVHLYVVKSMIQYADAVRVYSEPMKEIASEFNPGGVMKVKSYFDFTLLDGVEQKKHEKIRIVYATSRGNADPLAQICIPAIKAILENYPDQVEFYAFGAIPHQLKHFKNAFKLNYIHNYADYIKFFYTKGFDIGLAPGIDDRFHNSKTNNKFREYGAMQVCGIYSDIQIYRDCVVDHQNGILVRNTTEDWYHAIQDLIENPALRQTIKSNACETVKQDYSLDNTLRDWRTILNIKKSEFELFRVISFQNIAIFVDATSEFQTTRTQPLYELLGFCGIRYDIFDICTSDLKNIKDYDISICFFPNDKVGRYLTVLQSYGVMDNIIMDTHLPFDDCQDYPNILFTNPADKCKENAYRISDYFSFDTLDVTRMALEDVSKHADLGFEEQRKLYHNDAISNRDVRYSLNSPIFRWAQLLEDKSTALEPFVEPLSYKIIRKIKRKCKKVWDCIAKILFKITSPVTVRIFKVRDRSVYLYRAIKDYIDINYIKKY